MKKRVIQILLNKSVLRRSSGLAWFRLRQGFDGQVDTPAARPEYFAKQNVSKDRPALTTSGLNRNFIYRIGITLFLCMTISFCYAGPFLDGTSSLVYSSAHKVFHSGLGGIGTGASGAQGFVFLDNGFTILPDASAVIDTSIPVFGAIDLRETGTLILIDDLQLGSNVTLSSGGKIDGRGNQIILENNIMLPAHKIIHVLSNTKIDGRGHTLTVGDFGQLFIDNAMTLTLQNIVLRSGPKTAVFPPVRCAGPSSQLVLDNVVLAPQADIPFYQGRLYVYNDIFFTGTSSLIYTSSQTTSIMSGATLVFDNGTTFSFVPSTAAKNQMQLQDATSKIVLDGCTLKLSDSGMCLGTGRLLCDNKVGIDTVSGLYLSSIPTSTTWISSPQSDYFEVISWHPSGRFLATRGNGVLKIYSFDGTTFRDVRTYGFGSFTALSWSPDGKYLVVGLANNRFYIYQFDSETVTFVNWAVNLSNQLYGTNIVRSFSWSPDGKYLAVGGTAATNGGGSGFSNTNEVRIYNFNGNTIQPISTASQGDGVGVYMLQWDPTGNFLAVGSYVASVAGGFSASEFSDPNQDCLRVYSFLDKATLTPVASRTYSTSGGGVHGLAWSPDGAYLAVGGFSPNVVNTTPINETGIFNAADEIRMYRFSYNSSSPNSSLHPVTSRRYGSFVYQGIGWSPDGKTIAFCGGGPLNGGNSGFSDTNTLRIYTFDGTSLNPCASYSLYASIGGYNCAWHPAGKFLVASMSGQPLYFYGVSLNFTPSVNTQAMTNSLVFGNAAGGSGSNLKVRLLSGARVDIRGQVLDDSV